MIQSHRFWEWIGTITGILGGILIASNVPESKYGYGFFLFSAVTWMIAGILSRSMPMIILNVFYTCINLLGLLRWFELI